MPNHALGEQSFPNIYPKSLLTQAISLSCATDHPREEVSVCSSSHEEVTDCNEVSLQSPPG